MKQLYRVKIATGLEYESMADLGLGISPNDQVVIKCERYLDFATVTESVGSPIEDEESFVRRRAQQSKGRHIEGQKIPQILRVATEEDRVQASENDRQSRVAHLQTMERIKAHGLEMKLIHTHYAFDRKLIIFQFSADGRIDFRELLRDLSGLLKVRVELRQVGVRDEASILGGIGTCGRPFCCASFLPSFNSINVKMAKQQGLSLNPQNISGCCGRLKCCLQYEAEAYREMWEEMKRKQQSGQVGQVASSQAAAAAEASVPSEESMFDDEGTIVSARPITVAAASGTVESTSGKRPAHGHGGAEVRRERGDRPGGRRSERNGAERNGSHSQSSGRPQRNPQKHPLPPAPGEVLKPEESPGGNSPRSFRSGDRRRDRHGNERRREGGESSGKVVHGESVNRVGGSSPRSEGGSSRHSSHGEESHRGIGEFGN